ncbi:MAG: neurotransmitter:Na+ symporter, NSS family protein, partial [Bacteroidetes bacterium QH_2_63_10]
FGLPLATLAIIGTIGWAMNPEKLRALEINRNTGLYVGALWNPVVKYVIPLVMVGIVTNYAWANFGTPQMMGGVAVFVGVPLFGYLLMSYLEGRREPLARDEAR